MLSQDMILCSPAEQTRYKLTVIERCSGPGLIWWRVLQSHSQSMCFYYFYIISDSCHINHSVMMWIYSTKGLQRDLKKVAAGARDPKIKQRKLENKRSTQQLQISRLLTASFVLCFQNIKYMYTAVVHFSFLFVLHLCAFLWVFLMDDFHHTADKRPTLTHLENRAFYVASFRFCYH